MNKRLLIAGALAALGLSPSPAVALDPQRDAPEATARIGGRVVSAETGRPLQWALVQISTPQGRHDEVRTDAQGRYRFSDLLPGRYRLDAHADRYLWMLYGNIPIVGSQGPKPLVLREGELFDKADFALPRGAAIEGRVTDEYGDPAPGVIVHASRLEFFEGRRRLVPVALRVRPSDDKGQFRIYGLDPGAYYVSALPGSFVEESETAGFGWTYYPGTPQPGAAAAVRVASGQDAVNISFQLIPARMAAISGRVLDASGTPVSNGSVWLTLSDRPGISDFMITRAVTNPDGTFVFRNVPPGSYTLQGFGPQTYSFDNLTASEFGWLPVALDDVDQTELVLLVAKGASLRGRVVLDDTAAPPPKPADVTLDVVPIEFDSAPVAGGPVPFAMREDWTFELSNLSGQRVVRGEIRTPAWSVKRITLDGKDMTDTPFDFRKSGVNNVEVVLTSRAPSLSGVVTDDTGRRLSDCSVIVFSSDNARWTDRSRFVRLARSSPDGTFRLQGLPPDDYLVVALPGVTGSEWQDPDFLEAHRSAAIPIALVEGDARSIELRLTRRR